MLLRGIQFHEANKKLDSEYREKAADHYYSVIIFQQVIQSVSEACFVEITIIFN